VVLRNDLCIVARLYSNSKSLVFMQSDAGHNLGVSPCIIWLSQLVSWNARALYMEESNQWWTRELILLGPNLHTSIV
jgi:hypothetical protein